MSHFKTCLTCSTDKFAFEDGGATGFLKLVLGQSPKKVKGFLNFKQYIFFFTSGLKLNTRIPSPVSKWCSPDMDLNGRTQINARARPTCLQEAACTCPARS